MDESLDMERSSRRGKIPQKDWPSIIARHEAGETLSSIARTYDCSAPAISYIVSRTRTRKGASEGAAEDAAPPEQELVKSHSPPPNEEPGEEKREAMKEPVVASDPAAPRESPRSFDWRPIDGTRPGAGAFDRAPLSKREALPAESGAPPRPAESAFPQPNGGQRRILHLSLGNSGHGDGAGAPLSHSQSVQGGDRPAFAPPAARQPGPPFSGRAGAYEPAMRQRDPDSPPAKEAAGSLDLALRERVDADIAAFLAAFDSALADDTAESRALLREATDRLLRAGARTRIELERLEARLPLPPRDQAREGAAAWRQR